MPDRRVVEVREYETRIVDAVSLSDGDRCIVESPHLDSRLQLRALDRDRLEIRADCHVGVVVLDALEIRVVPKLVGGDLGVLRMVEYVANSTAVRRFDIPRTLDTGGTHLRDLVCLLLARECESLLSAGPRSDYRARHEALPVLRGRLLPDRQLLHRYGRLDQLECRYDERSTDILDNRLCAAALALAARTATAPGIRSRVRRLAADFRTLCDPGRVDHRQAAAELHYGRHNEYYRPAHRWALLLLNSGGIRDLFSSGPADERVFLLDMNVLFEDFVTCLTGKAVAPLGVTVRAQSRHRGILVHEDTATTHSEVCPDLMLTVGHGPTAWRRPLDVKYKLYADRKLSAPDLYQAFLYSHALSADPRPDTTAECLLVYPGPRDTPPRTVAVRTAAGRLTSRITAHALDVPEVLEALMANREARVLRQLADQMLAPSVPMSQSPQALLTRSGAGLSAV
ncbi:hypothetical protein HRW14_17195 [Streptomyces lunaelactis]|uniref:McrC family protein n=1 Tax=Streptomyces lunaelactis TaxID=1535768 RepID=UPI001584F802|nr:hypothetical protein [Streptomyces lunaelactis]NUK51974.1 hypothetical protein [Streptomyces lunaelactis]NUK65070.1 hypothetical protein [Streptomyces lunaelactis]